MASKNPKSKQTKSEPGSTKWLRIFLIVFSILLIHVSMVLSLTQ